MFALSRFGGLRCPSEHFALTWDDIDWDKGRMTVHASKTEHHEGGGVRVVPIFPELRPYLDDVYHEAPAGPHVINRYRDPAQNLRTQLMKIINRAARAVPELKLKPWPRLWHNLRASRQTELAAEHPLHVVCEWIGNSRLIAQEHYLRVTKADFQKATEKSAVKSAVQPPPRASKSCQERNAENEESPEKQAFSEDSEDSNSGRYCSRTISKTGGKTRHSEVTDAQDDARNNDSDIARLIEVWPRLPRATRERIISIIESR